MATCPGLIKRNESLSSELDEKGAQHGHGQVTCSAWDSCCPSGVHCTGKTDT